MLWDQQMAISEKHLPLIRQASTLLLQQFTMVAIWTMTTTMTDNHHDNHVCRAHDVLSTRQQYRPTPYQVQTGRSLILDDHCLIYDHQMKL